ncbi:dihydrofolate reductase family protein [Arthrobacter sp. 35W]|uniref:dihydrofolate reductase family protein n=1 Tax=Arthrobacter sp. 35W TaxID=1132441 RepID=UPI0004218FDC|nr:dihydrofolate reductase family protein [Arthrobacter sp. 35W]
MPKLRVHNFSMSLDGYAAGPLQDLKHPLGRGGERLHEWVFETVAGHAMFDGGGGGSTGIDNEFLERGDRGIGATIMGRNMFGPIRGPWLDEEWTGWWGGNPPYHHPVFVLTRYPRPPLVMEGGTTFNFTNDSIEDVLERAFTAANGADVRLGGGVSTVQQYLRASLVDELHVALVPVLLGSGERLFDHLDGGPTGMERVEFAASDGVVHVVFARR